MWRLCLFVCLFVCIAQFNTTHIAQSASQSQAKKVTLYNKVH